jgi:hypothetical protein
MEIDCDDSNSSVNPGVLENCSDSIDNNCNGAINEDCVVDSDNDGIPDDVDLCPGTLETEIADATGCAPSQLDADGDEIALPDGSRYIPINNPSFESDQYDPNTWVSGGTDGPYWLGVSNWSNTGETSVGVFSPTTNAFYKVPDGVNILAMNYGSASQTLPTVLTEGMKYTLNVDVGKRISYEFLGCRVDLIAGSTVIASNNCPTPGDGLFETITVSYEANAADQNLGQSLSIVLAYRPDYVMGAQVAFDNVRLVESPNNLDDDDGDGLTPDQGDCADADSSVYPGATEICGDGIDQDCDGVDDVCEIDLDEGLVAYYPFNGNADDESENGNDGTVYGATLAVDRFGNTESAYSFDGEDDGIKIFGNVIQGSIFTTSMWVKTADTAYALISGANSINDNEYLLYVDHYLDSNLEIYYHSGLGDENRYVTEIKPSDNTWHMITVTSGPDKTSFYVDGVLSDSTTFGVGADLLVESLWIGKEQDCIDGCWADGQQYYGVLDDIRIYNRALSEAEIQELYDEGNVVNYDIDIDGSFETLISTDEGPPTYFDIWSGDFANIVNSVNGVMPYHGEKMLQFVSSTQYPEPSGYNTSELWQIIDLNPYRSFIDSGNARASASAYFNRIAGDDQTDTNFGLNLSAYAGEPNTFPSQYKNSELATVSNGLISDGNLASWERVETELVLPAEADFIVIRITASENIVNDFNAIEFDGHYADSVSLEIVDTSMR